MVQDKGVDDVTSTVSSGALSSGVTLYLTVTRTKPTFVIWPQFKGISNDETVRGSP